MRRREVSCSVFRIRLQSRAFRGQGAFPMVYSTTGIWMASCMPLECREGCFSVAYAGLFVIQVCAPLFNTLGRFLRHMALLFSFHERSDGYGEQKTLSRLKKRAKIIVSNLSPADEE